MKNIIATLAIALQLTSPLAFAGKIQNEDVKSLSELTTAGGTAAQLINDSKIYVTANGINSQLSSAITNGQLGGSGGAGGVELLPNPNFEAGGITGYTASGGTLAAVTSGANLLFGNASASFAATALNQYVSNAAVSLKGLAGTNCSISAYYKYAGNAGDYSIQAYDVTTSSVISSYALPTQSTASPTSPVSFVCPATSTDTVQFRLISNVASPSTIYFDNLHFGSSQIGQVAPYQLLGSIQWVTGVNSWTIASSTGTYSPFPANTSIPAPTVTGSIQATATRLPAFIIPVVNPGTYKITAIGSFTTESGSTDPYFAFYDGNSYSNDNQVGYTGGASSSGVNTLIGYFTYNTAQSNLTFSVQAKSLPSGKNLDIGLGEFSTDNIQFVVEYIPSTTLTTINPSVTPGSWSGYHTTSAGWSTTSTTVSDYSNATGISLTQITNRNFGSVVTASGSLPGITFSPPRLGNYNICAYPNGYGSPANSGFQARLVDGSGSLVSPLANSISGTNTAGFVVPLCGNYLAQSLNPTTFKVQFGQFGAGGTGTINTIQWTVVELDAALPSPVFTGNVTSPSSQVSTRLDYFSFAGNSTDTAACTSSPCTVTNTSDPGVTVTRSAAGTYLVNLSTPYGKVPSCSANFSPAVIAAAGLCTYKRALSTTSSLYFYCLNTAQTSTLDSNVDAVCSGQK